MQDTVPEATLQATLTVRGLGTFSMKASMKALEDSEGLSEVANYKIIKKNKLFKIRASFLAKEKRFIKLSH